MDEKYDKGQIYYLENSANRTCCVGFVLGSRLYIQRRNAIPPYIFVPAIWQWIIICEKSAYALSLLGICFYEPSPWISLEYDDGNGKTADKKFICYADMGVSYHCPDNCRIWCVCVYKTGHRQLFTIAKSICIF